MRRIGVLWGVAPESRVPVIGFLNARSPDDTMPLVAAFSRGLAEGGFVEGQNTPPTRLEGHRAAFRLLLHINHRVQTRALRARGAPEHFERAAPSP